MATKNDDQPFLGWKNGKALASPAALSMAQPSSGWTMSLCAPEGGPPWQTTALESMFVNREAANLV